MSQLRQLFELVAKSLDALEKACAESGTRIPDLHESFDPTASDDFSSNLVAAEAASAISAAALQMYAILGTPRNAFFYHVGGVNRPLSLFLGVAARCSNLELGIALEISSSSHGN